MLQPWRSRVTRDHTEQSPSIWKRLGTFVLSQWLIIGLGVACLLAYLFPDVAKKDGIIKAQFSILHGAVIIIFLISGLSIPRDKLVTHMLNCRLHIITQGASYLVIPLTVFSGVYLIDATDPAQRLSRAVLAGYVLLGCLPTTLSSNVIMTRAAGGDDAAALVEVLIANVLGPFISPGWTMTLMPRTPRFEQWASSSTGLAGIYASTFKQLSLTVLLPLAVGQAVRWTFHDTVPRILAQYKVNKLSSVCLLLIVWSSFSTCFATGALETLSKETIAFTTLINVGLYLSWTLMCFVLARPPSCLLRPKPDPDVRRSWLLRALDRVVQRMPVTETIAVCFCGPAKTTGLGIPLLYAMYSENSTFDNAQMSVPVILFTTQQIFVAHIMVHLFRRWSHRVCDAEECGVTTSKDEEQAHSANASTVTLIAAASRSKDSCDQDRKVHSEDGDTLTRPPSAITIVSDRLAPPHHEARRSEHLSPAAALPVHHGSGSALSLQSCSTITADR